MGADVLVTQGARASTTMKLSMLNWNNSVPARWLLYLSSAFAVTVLYITLPFVGPRYTELSVKLTYYYCLSYFCHDYLCCNSAYIGRYVIHAMMVYFIATQNSDRLWIHPDWISFNHKCHQNYMQLSTFLHDCHRHEFYGNWPCQTHDNHTNGMAHNHTQTVKYHPALDNCSSIRTSRSIYKFSKWEQ